ncbi:MAG: hypothetical protein HQL95_01705 [Magnetococcales bacterium]|nr:hypothetical protein [Magnetococcales bacterium]
MPTPSWPSTLPQIMRDGFSITPQVQTIRTDTEAGPSIVRRVSHSNPDMWSVGWMMTDGQFATFQTWFDDPSTGINSGTVWFNFTVPSGTLIGRFVGAWKADKAGTAWKVSATLEVLPA